MVGKTTINCLPTGCTGPRGRAAVQLEGLQMTSIFRRGLHGLALALLLLGQSAVAQDYKVKGVERTRTDVGSEVAAMKVRFFQARAFDMEGYAQRLRVMGYTRGECAAKASVLLDVQEFRTIVDAPWPPKQIREHVENRIGILKRLRCLPRDF